MKSYKTSEHTDWNMLRLAIRNVKSLHSDTLLTPRPLSHTKWIWVWCFSALFCAHGDPWLYVRMMPSLSGSDRKLAVAALPMLSAPGKGTYENRLCGINTMIESFCLKKVKECPRGFAKRLNVKCFKNVYKHIFSVTIFAKYEYFSPFLFHYIHYIHYIPFSVKPYL